MKTAGFLNRIASVFCDCTDVKIGLAFKNLIQSSSNKGIIIRDQDCVTHDRDLSLSPSSLSHQIVPYVPYLKSTNTHTERFSPPARVLPRVTTEQENVKRQTVPHAETIAVYATYSEHRSLWNGERFGRRKTRPCDQISDRRAKTNPRRVNRP